MELVKTAPGVLEGFWEHTVDLHLAVCDNGLDLALLLKVLQALACQRTVDLKSVDEGGNGHKAVRLDILVELLGSVLVEEDGVLGLVLDWREETTSVEHFEDGDVRPPARVENADGIPVAPFAESRSSQPGQNTIAIRSRREHHKMHLHSPLPFDHFFFCFLAPVLAGAMLSDLLIWCWLSGSSSRGTVD